ncbi:ComEC/Rec2 family competence protein [Tessaracoccus sp. SD287]|uniref:ComEC/Rec2 family competence protein n=1 Tax=Tessaracoccus sp. SD287 TaxID=2782008 RepID=UPI001A95E7E2|nr:ComEC/Rec2 family competence protein [Tessaracoccus sp. SD287]
MKTTEPVDLRLVAPAALAWLTTWWVLTASPRAAVACAVTAAASALVAGSRRGWAAAALCLVVLACAGLGALRVGSLTSSPLAEAAAESALVHAELVLTSDAKVVGRPGMERAVVPARTVWVESRGSRWQLRQPVQVVAPARLLTALVSLPAGATVRVEAIARTPQPGQPQAAELRLTGAPETLRGPRWWGRQVNRVRAGLVNSMSWSPAEQAGLVPSLVVGDTSGVLPQTKQAFQATGLTHLTAVSGTNLTLLLATMLVVARVIGVRGRWLHLVGVAGVVVFVVVCRAEPSVLRASAMGVVGLAAVGASADRRRGLRHLCVAVIVLMVLDPWLARSWGFALSASASAGILWWGPPWRQRLARWLPGWLADSLAVPLAAQLATQPLVTALSGTISTSGLLANVLVGPFVGPTTILGLCAAVVALVAPVLASAVGWLAGWCVQPIILIAHAGAGLPAATWAWPPGPEALVLLTVVCLVAGLGMGWVLARRWASLLLAVLMVAAMIRQPPPAGWPGPWAVAFCAVGQGDATVLNAGGGRAVLVDAGPEPGPVNTCLASLGVRELLLVVITHNHADHLGGLAGVVAVRSTRLLLVNPLQEPAASHRGVAALAEREQIPVRTAAAGMSIVAGGVALRVVQAGALAGSGGSAAGESSAENDSSIVLVAQVGQTKVLLPGDVEPLGQQVVMSTRPDLRVHVIKMPHHGSSRQEESFWKATGARVAVASAGERNTHGHPAAAALRLADSLSMRVLRTDTGESFTVWVAGDRLHVRAALVGA